MDAQPILRLSTVGIRTTRENKQLDRTLIDQGMVTQKLSQQAHVTVRRIVHHFLVKAAPILVAPRHMREAMTYVSDCAVNVEDDGVQQFHGALLPKSFCPPMFEEGGAPRPYPGSVHRRIIP